MHADSMDACGSSFSALINPSVVQKEMQKTQCLGVACVIRGYMLRHAVQLHSDLIAGKWISN